MGTGGSLGPVMVARSKRRQEWKVVDAGDDTHTNRIAPKLAQRIFTVDFSIDWGSRP